MSEGELAGRKRPRLAEWDDRGDLRDRQSTDFKNDEEIWYEDGTVILVVRNIGFRVYRGLLAERAEIFRDLFSIPQPPDSQLVFGCPVVHLSDTAVAFKEFLNALICEKRYIPEDDLQLNNLAYRIRLAHKYGAENLLRVSIQELQKLYPAGLVSSGLATQDHWTPRAIIAVNLADLTNTPSILPSALYACCQLPDDKALLGASLSDGTLETLSKDNLLRRSNGRVKLAFKQALVIHELFVHRFSDSEGCTTARVCRGTIRDMREEAIERIDGDEVNVLSSWDAFLEDYDPFDDLNGDAPRRPCSHCLDDLHERETEMRTSSVRPPRRMLHTRTLTDGWSCIDRPTKPLRVADVPVIS
ncbi:uncharacterized protein B0H18DRAFT_987382 [Fomitopsis serialis]|uniref:uncharacterized protein n=1 Tax=Fomitopsis serialis TaxID=139415 RepID=UPI0020073773|nr:uncharacterized protein B0H18DRAFT_987382 [Neoantrodia serialis]KAH9932275.1 hypothetical protein B0H18DRAFT_987382 [Neoantrodia serialis]